MTGPHPLWKGSPHTYQVRAIIILRNHRDRPVLPWSLIETDCGHDMCLNPEHMLCHTPTVIPYPEGVCVYCGCPAGTMDHLLPRPATGETLRRLVAVVPACANCNSRIGTLPSPNVAERRRHAQLSIERGYRNLLLVPERTPGELAQLGHYDLRPFQKAGIENPVGRGLCDPIATPLRPEYVA